MTSVFKKIDSTLAENYKPVSVLRTVSKVFEKPMQEQVNNCINKFPLFLCGYRKGCSAQFALMTLIKTSKVCLDQKGYTGAVLMNLSKAFDTINHELHIAKLCAYGFSKGSLEVILSYLSNRYQLYQYNA